MKNKLISDAAKSIIKKLLDFAEKGIKLRGLHEKEEEQVLELKKQLANLPKSSGLIKLFRKKLTNLKKELKKTLTLKREKIDTSLYEFKTKT